MLPDHVMMMDAFNGVKHDIVCLTKAGEECANPQLRQAILQFRNTAEQNQAQLARFATEQGWYIQSPPADPNLVQHVKQQLEQPINSAIADPNQYINV